MMEFIASSMEITRSILESQERVMLAYLNGSARSAGQGLPGEHEMRSILQFVAKDTAPGTASEPVLYQANLAQALPAASSELLAASDWRSPDGQSEDAYGSADVNEEIASVTVLEPETAAMLQETAVQALEAEMGPEQLVEALVEIVSQRTGYPPEMLDPEFDLEADLGIDSIKRVEILNNFRRLLPESKQNALEEGIEKLAGAKTLQAIMNWIRTEFADASDEATALDPNNCAVLESRCA
jgi:hypothetical protein